VNSSPAALSSIAARRVFVDGAFVPATVRIDAGTIASVDPFDDGADVVVADHQVLLPGLVDTHVHLNEPGRTSWEGFATGTAAAAAGGITTLVEMPLNSIPVTTTPEALAVKRDAARDQLAVDVAYWGGAVPENLASLGALLDAGVVGVKCFMAPSGIDEFGHLSSAQLETALTALAPHDGLLIAHAELEEHLEEFSGQRFADFVASRPPRAEVEAVRIVIDASARTGARAHIVHVSSAEAVDLIRRARADGVRITAETCPHYLALRAEDVPDGAGRFKCCPPVRDARNQDLLWEGVLDGTIQAIVSDHSPATSDLKETPSLAEAWGGIAGVQTGLRAVWTEAHRRGIPLERILPAFTTGPASIVRLDDRGLIAAGAPAHLSVFDPDAVRTLRLDELLYRNPMSPWQDEQLRGEISETYVRGELIYSHDRGLIRRAGRELLA